MFINIRVLRLRRLNLLFGVILVAVVVVVCLSFLIPFVSFRVEIFEISSTWRAKIRRGQSSLVGLLSGQFEFARCCKILHDGK